MKTMMLTAAAAALAVMLMAPTAEAQKGHSGGARGFSGGAPAGRGFSGGSPMGGMRSFGGAPRAGGMPSAGPRAFAPRGDFGGRTGFAPRGAPSFAGRPGYHHHHHRGHRRGYPGVYFGPSYAWGSPYYGNPYYYYEDDDYYAPARVYYGPRGRDCRIVKIKRNGKWRRVTRCR